MTGSGTTEIVASGFAAKVSPPAIGPQGIAFDGAGALFVADAGSIWRVTSSVPEPGTLVLLAMGLAASALMRRLVN